MIAWENKKTRLILGFFINPKFISILDECVEDFLLEAKLCRTNHTDRACIRAALIWCKAKDIVTSTNRKNQRDSFQKHGTIYIRPNGGNGREKST